METMGVSRIRQWVESRCAGHRLRSGSRRREHLLRRLGKLAAGRARHRMDAVAMQRQGEAIYRQFKWDHGSVRVEAEAVCQRLACLEERLSQLAREIRPAASRSTRGRSTLVPHALARQASAAGKGATP